MEMRHDGVPDFINMYVKFGQQSRTFTVKPDTCSARRGSAFGGQAKALGGGAGSDVM